MKDLNIVSITICNMKVNEIKKALEYAIQVGLDKFSLGEHNALNPYLDV